MGSLAHLPQATGKVAPSGLSRALVAHEPALDAVHRILHTSAHERVYALLDEAHAAARIVAVGAGSSAPAEVHAATSLAAHVVAELAARADLGPADTRVAVEALALAASLPADAAAFALYERVATSPRLLELPPTSAMEIQLKLLVDLDVVAGVAVWQTDVADVKPLLALGEAMPQGRARRVAQGTLRGRTSLLPVGAGGMRAIAIHRFGAASGALLATQRRGDPLRAQAYLEVAASALGPVLERELLLDRGAEREHILTQALEKRLMRVGFDLHDGPVQDVLALGGELRVLGRELYPFLVDSHRDLAVGRFDDMVARVDEIDGALREIAHMLESRTVTSRPLGETLHRMTDEFANRTGIDARLEIVGDPESLTSAQRITVFRALQESLTNVREHAGASKVRVALRPGRHSIEVEITDDGRGFDVERALARAAQHGRLGIVGMGERVRLLGGTFQIESSPGGPTTLRLFLPRMS